MVLLFTRLYRSTKEIFMTQPTHIEEIYKLLNDLDLVYRLVDDYPHAEAQQRARFQLVENFLRTTLTQLVDKDLEWARENAQPQLSGWEDSQRTISLADFINYKKEQ